ncbi:MAG: hypothetical protein COT89_02215 [Candidatus Colwellbacteria bacterium CG10_big_fil_rev_8_21_14_0_10_42_22]|uniref:DUF3553 domain-containing protein n=1 Tax=Candidatus Colwellbacteria bacterium CG10_big_fil_rev_8_21_14_0_10_42_22 TaxID=1974540 RepID=A0A2H0VFM0_9BACT|nr:MAG: hypothetical protein COT89_02215 [Candidatus Colwellbacteria bacterium CG10_big_fil_rev_8_21_14_0_10_42_22]
MSSVVDYKSWEDQGSLPASQIQSGDSISGPYGKIVEYTECIPGGIPKIRITFEDGTQQLVDKGLMFHVWRQPYRRGDW